MILKDHNNNHGAGVGNKDIVVMHTTYQYYTPSQVCQPQCRMTEQIVVKEHFIRLTFLFRNFKIAQRVQA